MKKNIVYFVSGIIFTLIIVVIVGFNFLVPIKFYLDVKNNFDGEYDNKELLESTLGGIADGFGDKHTTYFTSEEYKSFNQLLNTSYMGIGIMYNADSQTGNAQITQVLENSPASKEEIYPGDIIKTVNDVPIDAKNVENLATMIKEMPNVKIEIYRPSEQQIIEFQMELASYMNDSVVSKSFLEDDKLIGYINIKSFSNTTASEFESHLVKLESLGMNKLIIDVRNNGGGELDSVQKISNLLVEDSKPYLIIKQDDKTVETFISSLKQKKKYEIVGLENGYTASSSEVLLGALKEVNGSQIIGLTSYGKGSVQTLLDVGATGGAVKVTLAHWYTPDENSIDEVGIEPTIKVEPYAFEIPVMPIVLNEKLSVGNAGDQVRQLNFYLYVNGYDTDRESNVFTQQTATALLKFQADNSLVPTGILDVKSAKIIFENAAINIVNGEFDAQLNVALGE